MMDLKNYISFLTRYKRPRIDLSVLALQNLSLIVGVAITTLLFRRGRNGA